MCLCSCRMAKVLDAGEIVLLDVDSLLVRIMHLSEPNTEQTATVA